MSMGGYIGPGARCPIPRPPRGAGSRGHARRRGRPAAGPGGPRTAIEHHPDERRRRLSHLEPAAPPLARRPPSVARTSGRARAPARRVAGRPGGDARPPRSLTRAGRHRLPNAGGGRRGGPGDVPLAEMRAMAEAIPGARVRFHPEQPATFAHVEAPARSKSRWRHSCPRAPARTARNERRPGAHESSTPPVRTRARRRPRRGLATRRAGRRGRRCGRARLGARRHLRSPASARSVPYASLPGFPETTVAGHPGRLVAGAIGDRTALLLCGRVHGYEGYPAREVGFGVRVVAALGVRTLIVTNAAGAVDPALRGRRDCGHLGSHQSHLRLPSHGPQRRTARPAFRRPDGRVFDPTLRAIAAATAPARHRAHPLREAIYAGMAGPPYETPAEVRMLRTLGAGLVGMSTVHEVITARHAGLTGARACRWWPIRRRA